MISAALVMTEPLPIEIDPRPCELCGRTIDQHEHVDSGEGPEFFCYPDDGILKLWELADPRDAWRQTGELPPSSDVRNGVFDVARPRLARPYRTPKATIDAFFDVVNLDNPDYLKSWLAQHPRDAAALYNLWRARCSTAAA
jgi:hypothetical protein